MSKSFVLNSLKGLSAVVSGGSAGLGLATVHRLSKLGCSVAICDVKEPENLPAENCYFIKTDVSKEAEVKSAIDTIRDRTKKLDILVNCAGIAYSLKIFNMEEDKPHNACYFDETIAVNTIGTFNMIRYCCELFNKNEESEDKQRGVIINTSAFSAFDGSMGQTAYSASTGAVVSMTLPLARDLSTMGVRVNTIAPGLFHTTPMDNCTDKAIDRLRKLIPFPGRLGAPDEFAHLVQFIIENPMINGATVRIDGALRMFL